MEVATLNAKGSLFLTRPGLAAHATDVEEYRKRVWTTRPKLGGPLHIDIEDHTDPLFSKRLHF